MLTVNVLCAGMIIIMLSMDGGARDDNNDDVH